MIRSFSDEVCHQIITTYQNHSPRFVTPTDVEFSFDDRWIYFRFYIMHPRLEDHAVVRLQDGEITCNLSLGAYSNPIACVVDEHGLRWIIPPSQQPRKFNKSGTEAWMQATYALCQAFKPELQFLLGSKNLLSNTKEKASG